MGGQGKEETIIGPHTQLWGVSISLACTMKLCRSLAISLVLVAVTQFKLAQSKGGFRISFGGFGGRSGGGGRASAGGGGHAFSRVKVSSSTNRFRFRGTSGSGSSSSSTSYPLHKWSTVLGSSQRPYFRSKVGYGTRWGTRFPANGYGKYSRLRNGPKYVGLGVGAGFIGGSTIAASLGDLEPYETFGIYHRYLAAWEVLYAHQLDRTFNERYYNKYYKNNTCEEDCSHGSHCLYGVCVCNKDLVMRQGQCLLESVSSQFESLSQIVDMRRCGTNMNCFMTIDQMPEITCQSLDDCQARDINMKCGNRKKVCECRRGMRWNERDRECQLYINVNCKDFDYDSVMTFPVLQAVRRAEEATKTVQYENIPFDPNATFTPADTLKSSLLLYINQSSGLQKEDVVEAFCRDVDSFVFELNHADSRPETCPPLSPYVCATVYDSHDCSGGWSLDLPVGNMSFPYFSMYWRYRNDIDTVAVRQGCWLKVFTDTDFEGDAALLETKWTDGWWVLGDDEELEFFDNNIESLTCQCNN